MKKIFDCFLAELMWYEWKKKFYSSTLEAFFTEWQYNGSARSSQCVRQVQQVHLWSRRTMTQAGDVWHLDLYRSRAAPWHRTLLTRPKPFTPFVIAELYSFISFVNISEIDWAVTWHSMTHYFGHLIPYDTVMSFRRCSMRNYALTRY